MGTKKDCSGCEKTFKPNKYKKTKLGAIGSAAAVGFKIGGTYGIVSGGPGGGATGASVGAALAGGATALGAKSITVCPHCDKPQLY